MSMGLASSFLTWSSSASRRRRLSFACLTSTIVLGLVGCGDDEGRVEQDTVGTGTTPATGPTGTTPAPTATEPAQRGTVTEPEATTPASPEDRPGGAGDEVPARSQALFTGRGGSLRPRVVRVPPFIAIRGVLVSADGRAYGLRFGSRSLAVGPGRRSASATFDGLRPGRRLVGKGSGRVVIEASAEPGP